MTFVWTGIRRGMKTNHSRGAARGMLLAAAVFVLGVGPALGQPVQKYDRLTIVAQRAELKIGDRVVGILPRGETFVVQEVKDGWYWVSESDWRGWIRASEAAPTDLAIQCFSEAIRQKPTATDYGIRGRLRSTKGQTRLAIADFSEAIRLDPSQAAIYKERGLEYYLLRQFDKAIADYSQAARLDPNNPAYLALRANAYRDQGDGQQAIADYSALIRLRPDDRHAHEERAGLWAANREYDRAIADYDEAIRVDPSGVLISVVWVKRAGARLAKGDKERAMTDFDEAVRLSADDPWARDCVRGCRAVAWLDLERYGDVIEDLEQAIRLSPKQSGFHAILAWIRATCSDARYRDGAKAVVNATKAIELNRYPSADRAAILAAACAEAGEFDRAVQSQKKAIELAPPNEKKRLDGALELFEQSAPYRQRHRDDWRPGFSFDLFFQ